jgi:phosphatidylserine synthase
MTSVIIMGLLAGFLFVGGLPHFVTGIMGKGYPMPMGQATSAFKSVIWGWANWVVAVLLWHVAPMHAHPRAAFTAVVVSVLVSGLLMSNMKYPKTHHAE